MPINNPGGGGGGGGGVDGTPINPSSTGATTPAPGTFTNLVIGNMGAIKTIASGANLILQFEGDSLTAPAGYGGTTSTQTWPYYLRTNFAWAVAASASYNAATAGATYSTI